MLDVVRRTAATVLFVTHSIAEATLVGDDIIILEGAPSSVAAVVDSRQVREANSELALAVGQEVSAHMGKEAGHVHGE
jgi:ABC-type nitrate/sulfonate/bicarbonate transport system ATPase subunit